jgi:hypothetical protein
MRQAGAAGVEIGDAQPWGSDAQRVAATAMESASSPWLSEVNLQQQPHLVDVAGVEVAVQRQHWRFLHALVRKDNVIVLTSESIGGPLLTLCSERLAVYSASRPCGASRRGSLTERTAAFSGRGGNRS